MPQPWLPPIVSRSVELSFFDRPFGYLYADLPFRQRYISVGIVAEVVFETSFPLSPIALGDAFDLSLAEDVEAVHECDADVDFGGLAVGVS